MRYFFLKWWPQSMVSQTIALLLIALLGSQALGFLIFADERRQALLHEKRKHALARVVSVVRLLEESPPVLYERILEATNSHWVHFQLAEHSAVDTTVFKYANNRLQQRLLNRLGEDYTGRVLVAFTSRINCDRKEDDKSYKHHESHAKNRHKHHRPFEFIAAIALINSKQWLNVEIHYLQPPSLLVLPSLLSTLFTAIVFTIIVILMIKRITRPLVALTVASDKLGRGEVTPPLPECGPSDIRQTTRAFNQMNLRLQRFVQDRTRMLAAISHDLRTPITTLRLRAEFLEDTDSRRKILATLDEMQAMTEASLAFVREAAAKEDTRRVDLMALVASLCDDLADMGLDVQFAEVQQYPYACRPVSLKRALRNLIENAVRYGQRAWVAIRTTETELYITIDDEGPGISTEDFSRVFEPFVRLESSRNPETGGIGLGMSIARSIVHGHGGEIVLNNRPMGGLRVTVMLPDRSDRF